MNILVSAIAEKKGKVLKNITVITLCFHCGHISVENSGKRIASMKLGQRVRRVDSTGELVSINHILLLIFKRSSFVNINSEILNYRYISIIQASKDNKFLTATRLKVKVFVESDNEEIEYTSNHVIIAGEG